MSMNRNSILTDFLSKNNIKYRISGKFLRFPALWRGGNGLNVSLDTETGRWTDFAGGERGNFRELAEKLGLSADVPMVFERDPRAARRETPAWRRC